ncbi:MAG: hypothetical protein WD638_13885 [Nitriliruptoraceae bacterium]
MTTGPLDVVLTRAPDLAQVLQDLVSRDEVLEVLRDVADTPAPSQLSASTRGPVIARLIESWNLAGSPKVVLDRHRTGAVTISSQIARTRLVAHLDEVSYLLTRPTADGWELAAFCYHLADGPRPARAIRGYADGRWDIVATGRVQGDGDRLLFIPETTVEDLGPGDRVALYSPVAATPQGQVTGSLDNAAGVVSVLFAIRVLAALDLPYDALLPDEEEGPAGGSSQTISRGAIRALRDAAPADLTVVVDTHGLPPGLPEDQARHERGWGASLAEFSSAVRGSAVPPGLYRWISATAQQLRGVDAVIEPNIGGYVPRSDDVAAMLYSRAITLLGYPGSNRHFDHDLPVSHLDDLVHLARSLAGIAAAIELAEDVPA